MSLTHMALTMPTILNHSSSSHGFLEVRFKDYGAESVEVLDNGSGISPENYDGVGAFPYCSFSAAMATLTHSVFSYLSALKHHTSKLSSFSDLSFMRTFGFRGEALSSLCALADVSIITATKEDAPMGTMLELGKDGKVESRDKRVARQVCG